MDQLGGRGDHRRRRQPPPPTVRRRHGMEAAAPHQHPQPRPRCGSGSTSTGCTTTAPGSARGSPASISTPRTRPAKGSSMQKGPSVEGLAVQALRHRPGSRRCGPGTPPGWDRRSPPAWPGRGGCAARRGIQGSSSGRSGSSRRCSPTPADDPRFLPPVRRCAPGRALTGEAAARWGPRSGWSARPAEDERLGQRRPLVGDVEGKPRRRIADRDDRPGERPCTARTGAGPGSTGCDPGRR